MSFLCAFLTFFLACTPVSAYETPDRQLYSNAIILYDRKTNTTLFERNADASMYPASLTKMMTAVVVLEQIPDLSQTTTITSQMLTQLKQANASIAGYSSGEILTIEQLLYGLMLPSGADAANALASFVAGNVDAFVAMMNGSAKRLGMKHTFFMNPTGLDHPKQLTTASDMRILLDYALTFDVFRTISSTNEYHSVTNKHPQGLEMISSLMVGKDNDSNFYSPYLKGGKTGYTGKAGRCLASFASMGNMELIMISLQAPFEGFIKPSLSFHDAKELYDWAYGRMFYTTYANSYDIVQTIPVKQAWQTSIDVVWPDQVTLMLDKFSLEEPLLQVQLQDEYIAPIVQGEVMGIAKIVYDGQVLYETQLVAAEAIAHSSIIQGWQATIAFLHPFRYGLLALLVVGCLLYAIRLFHLTKIRRKRRRKRHRMR